MGNKKDGCVFLLLSLFNVLLIYPLLIYPLLLLHDYLYCSFHQDVRLFIEGYFQILVGISDGYSKVSFH